jgi:hypothetical protein
MAYIILFSKWLLPGDDAADDLNSALYVPSGSRTAGKSPRVSGLFGGKLQLTAFSRKNAPAVPLSPDVVLQEGDVVYVTGGGWGLVKSVLMYAHARLPHCCYCRQLSSKKKLKSTCVQTGRKGLRGRSLSSDDLLARHSLHTGSILATEQAARDYGLVILTSDHDAKGNNVLLDAAATNVEEGFELAATDNPSSTLLQVGWHTKLELPEVFPLFPP